MSKRKKVCIAYLGNPHHDTRITNLKESLEQNNCEVKVIGFDWLTPDFETYRNNDTTIFKLRKSSLSIFFYAKFKILLLTELFKLSADIFIAEDVYTLPFVKIRTLFSKGKIYYNSRELYAFLGGHRNRKILSTFLTMIERLFIKKVDLVLTTGEMDSKFLEDFYGIDNTLVIRNIPKFQKPEQVVNLHEKLEIDSSQKILLYQGVLLDGRGVELLINQLEKIPDAAFVILGAGEKREKWEKLAADKNLTGRVFFLGSIAQNELINYTAAGDIGICLIENISVSYYHALPNKLFEYIMAGLPIISSNLPQMKKVIEEYGVGICLDIEESEDVSEPLNALLADEERLNRYRENCGKAAQELNWQNEFDKVKDKLLS